MYLIDKLKSLTRIDYINYLILTFIFTLSFPGEIKRFILILLILLWITDKNRFGNLSNNDFKILSISLFIFLFYCLISYTWTESTISNSFEYIRKYWYLSAAFLIYKYLKIANIEFAIKLFLLGIFISEFFSYGNLLGFWEIGYGTIDNPTVFMHHIFYSIFLSVTASILFIKILLIEKRSHKIIYLLFLITVSMNLLLNVGRTGQISLIITICLICLLHYRLKIKYIFIVIFTLIIIITLNYEFNSTFKERINFIKLDIENIIQNNNYNTSLGGRIGFWIITKEIILDDKKNLFLGIGSKENINQAKVLIDEKYPELYYNKELTHFHSIYLSIISQFGLIGLLLFLTFIYSLLRINIINYQIRLYKYSVVSIFILSSIVDMPFYKDATLSLFALFIGLILIQSKDEKQVKGN